MQETRVQSLGQEDPLEKEMATHSSILAWKILWTEESGKLQSVKSVKSQSQTQQLNKKNNPEFDLRSDTLLTDRKEQLMM